MLKFKKRLEKAECEINAYADRSLVISSDEQIRRYEDHIRAIREGYKIKDYEATPYLRRFHRMVEATKARSDDNERRRMEREG
jgi:hypothetical protein